MSDKPFDASWSDTPEHRRNQQEHAEFEVQLQDVQRRQRNAAARVEELESLRHQDSTRLTEVLIDEIQGLRGQLQQIHERVEQHMKEEHAEFKEVHQAWVQAKGMGKLAVWMFAAFTSVLAGLAWAYEQFNKLK